METIDPTQTPATTPAMLQPAAIPTPSPVPQEDGFKSFNITDIERGVDAFADGLVSESHEQGVAIYLMYAANPRLKERGASFEDSCISTFGLDNAKNMKPKEVYEFFRGMVDAYRNSDSKPLNDFLRLSPEEQEKEVRRTNPKAKYFKITGGNSISGIKYEYADNPDFNVAEGIEERKKELAATDTWLPFLKFTEMSPELRHTAYGLALAEGSRSDIAEIYADEFLKMEPEKRADLYYAAALLSPKIATNWIDRVATRIGENATDTFAAAKNWLTTAETGVYGDTVYDTLNKLDALDANGDIIPEKWAAVQEELNRLSRDEEEKENRPLPWSHPMSEADYVDKVFDQGEIKRLYGEGKKRHERIQMVRQIRELKRTQWDREHASMPEVIEDAIVVGVEMTKYLAASMGTTALTKNPYLAATATASVMYAEFKPMMFDALRYDGNMSVEDADHYATYSSIGMAAVNFVGFTRWAKVLNPKSYLLGAEISKANAREYLFHAIKEYPKTLLREGTTETLSEYSESVIEYATKRWSIDHAEATFDEKELWDAMCEDFWQTTKVMPTLMIGTSAIGFGRSVNRIRRESGAGFNPANLVRPSDAMNHQVQTRAGLAQMYEEAGVVAGKYGATWTDKYARARTDEQRAKILEEQFPDEAQRKQAMEDVSGFDAIIDETQKARNRILGDIARRNAEDTARIEREAEDNADLFQEADAEGKQVWSAVNTFFDKFGGREDVVFVNSVEDLSDSQRADAEKIFAEKGRKGYFDPKTGKYYLIESNFKNGIEALETLAHERSHWVRELLRGDPMYEQMLKNVVELMGGDAAMRATLPQHYQNKNTLDIAEEYMARVVGRVAIQSVLDGRQKSLWQNFKSFWRRKFSGTNTIADITDQRLAEIAKNILQVSHDVVAQRRQAQTGTWSAVTPETNGRRVSGQYAVVDAANLVASTDEGYNDKLQPRNRSRRASTEQISQIATDLDPARLDNSATTDMGAPIIDENNNVVSGNGRVLAIRQAYGSEGDQGAKYRDYVLSRAKEMGLDAEGMAQPVLVRRVSELGDMTMEEFAARSNKSQVARMSNAETSIADARIILNNDLLGLFFPSENGDVLAASNNDFIMAFLDIVGGREEYIDANGRIKANLAPRLRSAVLAAMLNPEKRDVIENLLDNPDGWSGLIGGLMGSAANLAKLSGNADYDISAELSDATELFIRLRRGGESLGDYMAQSDMFENPISEETAFLVELFEKNTRTPSGIHGVLNEYYNLAKNIDTTTQDMFAEAMPAPTKIDELREAYRRYSLANPVQDNAKWSVKELLAPNGKPSNLTAEQWRQVRTPEFKKWFGDWEKSAWAKAAMDFLENTPAVKTLSGAEFQKDDIKLTEKVPAFFKEYGGIAHNSELGDVVLDLDGVKDSIAHGIGSLKAAAFMAVPDVIEKGFIFNRETNWKNRNYNSAVLIAPIKIGDIEYVCEVVVTRKPTENKFYLHEVEIKETLKEAFKTPTKGRASQASMLILGKHIEEVKGNVSKVVDENDEPLVVYHFTDGDFNVFDISQARANMDIQAFYFSSGKNDWADMGKRQIGAFLNIRNPKPEKPITQKSQNNAGKKLREKLISEGFDGIIDLESGLETEYAVFSPEQIKSATDNIGTFDSSNPDIRWSVKDDFARWINAELENLNMGTPEAQRAEIESRVKAIADEWASNPKNISDAADAYFSHHVGDGGQITVDPDDARHFVPGFNNSMIEAFINAGNKISAAVFQRAYFAAPNQSILFLSGNPGSGKSFARAQGLINGIDDAGIVLDSPLNNYDSVLTNVQRSLAADFKVTIVQIYNSADKSFINTIKRGVKTGRFVPWEYFKKAYTAAQGKVEKIESKLAPQKIETIYIDNAGDIPKAVNTEEAKAWQYSIDESQLTKIIRYIYENQARIRESAYKRGDKVDPLAVITRGLYNLGEGAISQANELGRLLAEIENGIQERRRSVSERRTGLRLDEDPDSSSRVKNLLRQDREENPVVWASIVLAKEILRGHSITSEKIEKVLPRQHFDGSKQNYAVERAQRIAEKTKAEQRDYVERLDKAVKLAENNLYWQEEFVEQVARSFTKHGEEYGFAKQKVLEHLKRLKSAEFAKLKGYETSDFDVDLVDAIVKAAESEPERFKKAASESEPEIEEEFAEPEFGGESDPGLPKKAPMAPAPVRDVIKKIRQEVIRRVNAADGNSSALNEKYRKTLVNILTDAAHELSYGIERERIMAKINELAQKKYAVITIKDGERAGQKIDNFTLRAENIALRIFRRGVRDSKNQLFEKFEQLTRHVKDPKRVEREDKRKMSGAAQLRAKRIKDIAYLPQFKPQGANEIWRSQRPEGRDGPTGASQSSEDAETKTIDSEIEKAVNAINDPASADARNFAERLVNAVQYLTDLRRFGALRDKSRAEMAEAIEWYEKFLESETDEQAAKVEEIQAEAEARRKIFIDAINEMQRNAKKDSKMRELLRKTFATSLTFRHLLENLGRAATGEKYAKFRALTDKMVQDAYAATTQKENEIFRLQGELTETVSKIYGMDYHDGFKHLMKARADLDRFSVQGEAMTVQLLLQRLAMAEQKGYVENVYEHCVKKTPEVRALQEKIREIEGRWLDTEKTGADYERDMREVESLEKELLAEKELGVARYAESLRAALTPQDLGLLDWFREFYARERESLSSANELVTGLGIEVPDPLYVPMKMKRPGGMNEKVQTIAIVPKSLTPRVPNRLDMDEKFGIIDMWADRIAENAHYKAFSQLNIEWRGVFAHADFHVAVENKMGGDVLSHLLDHVNDITAAKMDGGPRFGALDKANGVYAILALGFNLGSGVRQVSGAAAFANYIGYKNTLKYAGSLLTPEGRAAAIEILNSDTAKRRMARGNQQILVEALSNIDDNKFWAWYKRNAMVFNRWGDILPIMTIGQGIYRAGTEKYLNEGYSAAEAKQKAMADMWNIAEISQQSPSVMNMAIWQRRWGSVGKAVGLFISQPGLMLSKEVADFNRYFALKKKSRTDKSPETLADLAEARKQAAKTFFANHVLVQGGYAVLMLMWKAALGDDWDEEDAMFLLSEMLIGPFAGLIIFGRFASAFTDNFGRVDLAPIEGYGRILAAGSNLLPDIYEGFTEGDWEAFQKDLDKMLRGTLAPYRELSKIYHNLTDDEEGVFW